MPWTSGVGDGGPYSQDQMRIWGKILGVANEANIGIVPSILNLLAPSSSGDNNLTANTGYAIVDGTLYENDASEALTVTSPSGGTTGVRLSLRKTWADREVRLVAVKNTDGVSAIPSLVQVDGTTWDIPIATCEITTVGVIQNLTDVREFTRQQVIGVVIDGAGSPITAGVAFDLPPLPANMVPLSWTVLADVSGSIVLDLWKDVIGNFPPTVADTVTGSDKPTLSGQTNAQGGVGSWGIAWSKGDIIRVNVDSAATVNRVTLAIDVAVI